MFEEWDQIFGIIFFFCISTIILVKITKRSIYQDLRARDDSKGHYWCYTGLFLQPSYCSICDMLMASNGAFCGACSVCADQPDCIEGANNSLPCKKVTTLGSLHHHHWIKGNLPLGSICEVCEEECGILLGLSDLRCCWCQRMCHTHCQSLLTEICDFGSAKNFIIPPHHIGVRYSRLRKQCHIKSVTPINLPNWKPFIVIGNASSGSQESDQILSLFRQVLNPAQVVDLNQHSPEEALNWCRLLPNHTVRVIVAGGDGTVGWVLNTIYKFNFKNTPLLCILPLGTGNDLSRVIGWGDSYSHDRFDPIEYLQTVSESPSSFIDRWCVSFTPSRHMGLRMPSRQVYMNNYLSVGVDALVTLNFHKTRQSPFYICSNRLINKLIYFTFGTKDVLMQECKNLHERVDLEMDGIKMELPEMEALVVLNIECWGAGVRPWTLGAGGQEAPKQSFNDRLLEVFCVSSSFHIAQLQVGLTAPIRIGQCSKLKLKLKSPCPMQVDGEPWLQSEGSITVGYSHSAKVIIGGRKLD